MAIKDVLLIIAVVGIILGSTVEAETLEGRSECNYEVQTEKFPDGKLHTYQKERCVEEPGKTIRTFQIGDLVRESWITPHSQIKEYRYDSQLGIRCKWAETFQVIRGKVVRFTLIIGEVEPNTWRVIDKF